MHFDINSHTEARELSIGLSDCIFSMRPYPNVIHYANTVLQIDSCEKDKTGMHTHRGNDREAFGLAFKAGVRCRMRAKQRNNKNIFKSNNMTSG